MHPPPTIKRVPLYDHYLPRPSRARHSRMGRWYVFCHHGSSFGRWRTCTSDQSTFMGPRLREVLPVGLGSGHYPSIDRLLDDLCGVGRFFFTSNTRPYYAWDRPYNDRDLPSPLVCALQAFSSSARRWRHPNGWQ